MDTITGASDTSPSPSSHKASSVDRGHESEGFPIPPELPKLLAVADLEVFKTGSINLSIIFSVTRDVRDDVDFVEFLENEPEPFLLTTDS